MHQKQPAVTTIKGDVKEAREQLNLILGFFPRIDAKFPIVLGLDVGMLGVLAAKVPGDLTTVNPVAWWLAGAFCVALVFSLVQLFRGSFPNVKGGQESIVFFGHISKMREQKFIDDFGAMTPETLATELLGQAWRNAAILSDKISALRWSYLFMVVAAIPWALSLAELAKAGAAQAAK